MGAEELVNGKAGFYEMEEENFSDSELVYHVRDALTSVSSGDSDSYNQLVGVMHHTERLAPDEVALLVTSLKALAGAVSYIDNVLHESLLSSIWRMSMWNYGPDVMDALLELIISLAASNGKYVDSCLEMIVGNFIPPYSFIEILKQPRGFTRKDQVLSRLHSALNDITELVPLAPARLSTIVCQRMPYITAKESLMVIYVENMLKLESGAIGEFLRSSMLKALIDKLIDLDLEIGWDDISQDNPTKGIFEMELEDMDDIADFDEENGTELPRELSWKSVGGSVVAEKLDSLMVLTFEHLESCQLSGRLIEVFETLLESFQITILTAYKSKFSQFVMFYACALDPENCGVKFPMLLADIFDYGGYPPFMRMSAVAYLASYLARGKFLSAYVIASMLRRLVDWCLEYCKMQDGEINPAAHRVFYSGCQAIMYVLCFRMRSVMDVPWFKSQLLMPIERILTHKLNPLKVCLPSIVDEFCRQAEAACLFTSSEEFASNNLLESEHSRAFGGMERLDMFFPFDPCLLRKCDREASDRAFKECPEILLGSGIFSSPSVEHYASFIRPHFVYWSMVRPPYDDDEGGTSDEDVAEQDFDLDVSKMSITPKNSLAYGIGNALQDRMRMPSRIRPSTSPESL